MPTSARSIPLVPAHDSADFGGPSGLPALSPPGGGGVEKPRGLAWRPAIGALALALLLWPGAVWAQPAAEDETEAEAQEERDEPEGVEEIVVTGSRIRRDTFTSALPITVITATRSTLAGLADTAEILQSSALASGTQIDNSFGGFVVSGGPGANTFGLRGLGADRTLVLVNGRRISPAGVRGQVNNVDLNSIPYVAVDRFEILKDGASSVYGADAVAGVVNIITRKQFDELRLNVRRFDRETDAGDISFSWGKTGDRGYVDVAMQYTDQSAIKRSERDWAHCDERPRTDGGLHPSAFPPTSGGRVGPNRCFGGIYGLADVGGLFFGYQPGADLLGTGQPYASPQSGYRSDRDWDDEDLIPDESLIHFYADGERDFDLDRVGWLGPMGDFFGTVTGNFELYYSRRENNITNGYRQFFPSISLENPTNELGRAVRQVLENTRVPTMAAPPTNFAEALRRVIDPARLTTTQPIIYAWDILSPGLEVIVSTYALRGGLEGDIGPFHWDFSGSYSFSRGEWSYETLLRDRVARSLSAVRNADGSLSCTLDQNQLLVAAGNSNALVNRIMTEGEDPNCVPVNLFTEDAMLNGRLPADAKAYLVTGVRNETKYNLATLNFNIESALFNMPFGGGEVRGVLGLEWRARDLDDIPPLAAQENNQWGFTSASRTKGDDSVKEAFAEIEFPLLAGFAIGGISVAEELTFNVSGRYTDQSSYGSDTTYRGLLSWAINPIVRFRATYGTSFRAPSLYEFHLAQQTGFVSGTLDPCDGIETDRSGSTAALNCRDLVAAGTIPPNFASSSLRTISGGNSDLKAETSDSRTIGLVLTPDLASWLPVLGLDLSLAVDFYDIQIENSIAQLPSRDILDRCYGSRGLTAPECDLIGPRNPVTGVISSLQTNFRNIAEERSSGFDVTLRTEREFSFGELRVNLQGSRVISVAYDLTGDELQEQKGHHTFPRWRGEADISFERRAWRLNWDINYIGRTSEEPEWQCGGSCSTPGVTNVRTAAATFFHNVWLTYEDPQERFSVTAGIRNLFNQAPPVVGWQPFSPAEFGNIAYNVPAGGGYDRSGRRAYVIAYYNF